MSYANLTRVGGPFLIRNKTSLGDIHDLTMSNRLTAISIGRSFSTSELSAPKDVVGSVNVQLSSPDFRRCPFPQIRTTGVNTGKSFIVLEMLRTLSMVSMEQNFPPDNDIYVTPNGDWLVHER